MVVDLGNPLSRTTAGRMEIADRLLDKGMIKVPQEYLTVLETGNLEPMTQGIQTQLSTIHAENERMLGGHQAAVLTTDAHLLHVQEHLTLLSNPEVRMNSSLTGLVLDHIQEHKNLYQTQDPFFSMVAGEPPAPPVPPGPPMPPPVEAVPPLPAVEPQPFPQPPLA